MTAEELKKVEEIVNQQIDAARDVHTDVMSLDEAKKTGAMALFDEKYGEKVRVVSMGDFSRELCGGTHVKNTAQDQELSKILELRVGRSGRRKTY